MANQCNDIGDIVKKVNILLLDIEGTTTSISFVKDKLFPYALENVKQFLDGQWETDVVKEVVGELRKLALDDEEKSVEGLVKIPGEDATKEEQIEGLVNNVKWLMSSDRKVGPLKQLQGLIWKSGYDKGDIMGHVYDDVSPALQQWRSVEGKKVYIYSSGSVQAQKLLFGQSLAGDLLKYIDGHFDTAVGGKQEAASYTKIVEEIGCKTDEVLFLTDILKEAEAARSAGLHAALLSREGNAALPEDISKTFALLQTFAQLTPTNKRKNDQDEKDTPVQPPKIAKTDSEEVKPNESEEASNKNVTEKTEKMEVEETEKPEETKTESLKVDTVVEEVTNDETKDTVAMDAEPIITEEISDKEKVIESEKDTTESKTETKDVKEKPEETPSIVTIEELSNDKSETGEVIENIVPVVEEPPSVDMDDLENVSEVLQKECDEILTKVENVTNMDNITVKPHLNTIEEAIESENTDTNDIVDRILDSEIELEKENETKDKIAEDINKESKATTNGTTEEKKEKKGQVAESVTENKNTENDSIDNATVKTDEETKTNGTEESKVKEKEQVDEAKSTEEKTDSEIDVKAESEITNEKTEDVEKVVTNGTNGNTENVNGDSKKEEINSRLGGEDGEVNGANGNKEANGNSNGKEADGEKVETEVSEIKVKTVESVEAHVDPIEQTTEA